MIITYTPDGQDPQTWEWDPGRLRMSEATLLEKKIGGGGLDNLKIGVLIGDSEARRVVLWSLLRRDHPKLRFDDVDPYADEIKVEANAAELKDWRDRVATAKGVDELKRDQFLTALDKEIAALDAAGGEPGKAISTTGS